MSTDQLTTLVDLMILWDTEAGAPFPFPNETLTRLRTIRNHFEQDQINQALPAIADYTHGEMERAYAAALLTRYLRQTPPPVINDELRINIINKLAAALTTEPGLSARIAIVRALQAINHFDALVPLIKALRDSLEPDFRAIVANAIRAHNTPWSRKLSAIITSLNELQLFRIHLDAAAILTACLPIIEDKTPSVTIEHEHLALTNALIEKATLYHEDLRMTGILAALITENCGRNLHRANRFINEYETTHQIASARLDPLRLEINATITPAELQNTLQTRFYQPIDQTHAEIKKVWLESIHQSQQFLRYRLLATLVIRGLGGLVLLIGAMGARQLSDATTTYLLLSIAGLALIILSFSFRDSVTDARQALAHIGIANAAYSAYVQRTLQISNGYAQQFLKGQLTPDDIAKSTELIQKALNSTVSAMNPDRPSLDDFLNDLSS